MKKMLSLALALVLCLSLAVPALAADTPSAKEIPDGEYTLTQKGVGEFVEQQLRIGYSGGGEFQPYATVYKGYYSLSADAAWTITNTPANKASPVAVSVEYYVPLGDNNYGAGVGYGVLIDKNGHVAGNTANGENWQYLEMVEPGGTVSFSLADILADEEAASHFQDLMDIQQKDNNDLSGMLLVLTIHQHAADSVEYDNDSYCYIFGDDIRLGAGGTDPGTTTPGFDDVKPDDWFAEPVKWALKKGITNGTGKNTFSPGQDCTEAQILTFLWRAKGCPEPENPVSSGTYYAKAAKWAVEQGIVDEFEADAPCTRAMTVDYLWRAAGKPQSGEKTPFTDVTAGTDLEKAVAWAVGAGVTNGTSETTFSPGTVCTRGHIVTFLYRNLAE